MSERAVDTQMRMLFSSMTITFLTNTTNSEITFQLISRPDFYIALPKRGNYSCSQPLVDRARCHTHAFSSFFNIAKVADKFFWLHKIIITNNFKLKPGIIYKFYSQL